MKAKSDSRTQEQIVAMNEALVLGSVRQHELTAAAGKLNTQLQEEITTRKRIDLELAEKARLLDLTNDAIIVRGLDEKISVWNKGAERMFGWTCQEVLGMDLHRLLRTEFPKPIQQIIADLYEGGHFEGEVTQIARNGRRVISFCRWVLDRGTESIMTSYTDISDRKVVENKLRQSEERYRTLFNSIDEGFAVIEIIFDDRGVALDFRFLEVNPSFEKQTGLINVVGQRMRVLAPEHEEYWFEKLGRVASTGQPVRVVQQAKVLKRWFDVYAFSVGGPDSQKVALIFSNVTDRMVAEEALRAAHALLADRALHLEEAVTERTAELLATNKQLESFVYSVAHDMRAPLRSMQGFSSLLLEESSAALDEDGRNYAHRISESAEFMDELLTDLLEFSAIAQRKVEPTSVRLENVLYAVLSRLEAEILEKKARIELVGPWPNVLGHEATLGTVLSNLITNALKFRRSAVDPHIRLRAEEQGEFLRVWVEDNGIGIAAEHQAQIFGLFTRLHGAGYPGTGIGLAIVQKGIERMLGRTGVESTPGQGSRFWFELWKA